ncbi:hypothetical protein [Bacteroides caecigallinarum]|nr:hypothetical protein [Bacteroides caecigallinarum]
MRSRDEPSFDINNYYARVPIYRDRRNISDKDDLQCDICGCT